MKVRYLSGRKFILFKSLAIVFEAAAIDLPYLIGANHQARIGFNDLPPCYFAQLYNMSPDGGNGAIHIPKRDGGRPLQVQQFFEVFF